jgi:metal-responsive CopG/Arc/MetJ family transcriptional regulator
MIITVDFKVVAMVTLTVTDDRLRQVDEFAKEEARSREDVVDEAIDIYVRAKEWDNICAYGRSHALKYGITEDVIN